MTEKGTRHRQNFILLVIQKLLSKELGMIKHNIKIAEDDQPASMVIDDHGQPYLVLVVPLLEVEELPADEKIRMGINLN